MATSIKNISILIFLFNIVFPQCDECENVWMDSYWGEQCCDVAWDQWGFDCSYMESEYGWDCAGCACPYDNNATCGDGSCNGAENIQSCPSDCTINGCNVSNQVDDCSDEDCCSMSWIGDGYPDCEDPNNFGCDLSCYDNDGGDCPDNQNIGDINNDNLIDIQDVIIIIDVILQTFDPLDDQYILCDLNLDNLVDIFDLIEIVNIILGTI